METEETFSERLPEDFAELGASAKTDRVPTSTPPATSKVEDSKVEFLVEEAVETVADSSAKSAAKDELPLIDLNSLEELPQQIPLDDSIPKAIAEKEPSKVNSDIYPKAEEVGASSTFDDEFEFELDSQASESVTEDLIQNVPQQSSPEQQKDLLNIVESNNSLSSAISAEEDLPMADKSSESDSESADMEQIMNLIQKDKKLAQEISQKLNISSAKLNNPVESPNNSAIETPSDLDSSSIDLIEGWFNLGLKQVSGGEFDKAIASWDKALSINPNLSEAWHNRGSALGRLGKYKEAVESFQKALTIDPHNYQAWSDRAHALYQLQNWAAAADSWSNAIKITPANHLFWYNRGCALEQLESWAESISSYE